MKFLWIALCLCLTPLQATESKTAKTYLREMERGINRILRKVDKNVHVGIEIVSLDSGMKLYEKNNHQLFVPASTTKLFTAGAALSYLGPDYTFKTRLLTDGSVEGEVLRGNLYFQGSGDPSFAFRDLEEMVLALRVQQIKKIEGDICIDASAFDEFPKGPGWMWDDVQGSVYSPMNALSINHNCIQIWVKPGVLAATSPKVYAHPRTGFITIKNLATTDERGKNLIVERQVAEKNNTIVVKGEIPLTSGVKTYNVPIDRPHLYAGTLLHSILKKSGIQHTGKIKTDSAPSDCLIVAEHTSEPLSILLHPMMKRSDNLYADNFFKKIGAVSSGKQGTWENGSKAVKKHLELEVGMDGRDLVLMDGSGLTRYNMVTPHQLVQYITWVDKESPFAPEFFASLPVGGREGCLKNRYDADLPILRAKTGWMTSISCLCGVVETQDRERIAFSIMTRGYPGNKQRSKDEIEDAIAIFLAKSSKQD